MTKEQKGKYFITNYELESMPPSYSNLPRSLLKAMYIRSLIGPGAEIPETDVAAMAFMLEPGTNYGVHAHLRPEIYIIVSGTADCEWGGETFTPEPGTVTYCSPNMSHAMRVTSKEPLRAIVVNWAPGGNDEVWKTGVVMLEEEA